MTTRIFLSERGGVLCKVHEPFSRQSSRSPTRGSRRPALSRHHLNPGGASPGGTYAHTSTSPPPCASANDSGALFLGFAAPSPGSASTAASNSSSAKNRLSCRTSCFASQSPTPRNSPTSLRLCATPPSRDHRGSGADAPRGPQSPRSSRDARVKTRVARPWISRRSARRARQRARAPRRRRAACSTPTFPASCHFVSVPATLSCLPRNACSALGTSNTTRVRSWRPATSASVSTMISTPRLAVAANVALRRRARRGGRSSGRTSPSEARRRVSGARPREPRARRSRPPPRSPRPAKVVSETFLAVDGSAAHASFETFSSRFRVRFGFRFPRRFSARVSQQLVRGASSRRSRVRATGLRLHGRLRMKRRDAGAGRRALRARSRAPAPSRRTGR